MLSLCASVTPTTSPYQTPVKAGTELFQRFARITTTGTSRRTQMGDPTCSRGAPVKKYGQVIGFAKGDIAPGDHVHTHNLVVKDFARDYAFCAMPNGSIIIRRRKCHPSGFRATRRGGSARGIISRHLPA